MSNVTCPMSRVVVQRPTDQTTNLSVGHWVMDQLHVTWDTGHVTFDISGEQFPYAAKRPSTKSSAENSTRSSIFSPTPTNRIGIFSSRAIAVTTPPFAVPSSFVRIN